MTFPTGGQGKSLVIHNRVTDPQYPLNFRFTGRIHFCQLVLEPDLHQNYGDQDNAE